MYLRWIKKMYSLQRIGKNKIKTVSSGVFKGALGEPLDTVFNQVQEHKRIPGQAREIVATGEAHGRF